MQSSKSTRSALQFEEFQTQLLKYDNLSRPTALLQLLLSLMNNATSSNPVPTTEVFQISSDSLDTEEPTSQMPSKQVEAEVRPIRTKRNATNDLDEQALLRDVLFIFQGIESKHLVYEPEYDSFRVPSIDTVSRIENVVANNVGLYRLKDIPDN